MLMYAAEDKGVDDISIRTRFVEPIGNRPIRYAGPVLPWLIGLFILSISMLGGLLQLAHF